MVLAEFSQIIDRFVPAAHLLIAHSFRISVLQAIVVFVFFSPRNLFGLLMLVLELIRLSNRVLLSRRINNGLLNVILIVENMVIFRVGSG